MTGSNRPNERNHGAIQNETAEMNVTHETKERYITYITLNSRGASVIHFGGFVILFRSFHSSVSNRYVPIASDFITCQFILIIPDSWLYRYVTRTNVSFFDPSPNDQRTEHSCV